MNRVAVDPGLVRWARERADRTVESLSKKFPRLGDWETGEVRPTFKQLESFAKTTHVPIGYLFLPEPPEERVPIPDLRTIGSVYLGHPSPDLLDTIYLCQRRQDWYRDWARSEGEEPCDFVGSVTLQTPVEDVAASMRERLGFEVEARRDCRTWTDALRHLIAQTEEAGVLVMVNGVVGSNNHRPLDPEEFRGFALADELAPLVFINGKDTKAAQIFTLAHELAHLWLGQSALTDAGPASTPRRKVEAWCSRVAGLLVHSLCEELSGKALSEQPPAPQRNFTTSSRRFTRAVIGSTLEGQTLFHDAFRLLDVQEAAAFGALASQVGPAMLIEAR